MIDDREIVRRAVETLAPPEPSFDRLVHRRDRVQRSRRIRAGAFGLAVAVAVGWLGVNAIPNGPTPADDRSTELGIFTPVAGRIVYGNLGRGDGGWRGDIWGVDPAGAADPMTRVQLTHAGIPLAWSSDGTQLLIKRGTPSPEPCCVEPWWNLFVVHADGSETRVTEQPMKRIQGATISPDGSRVVFADYHALNGIDIGGDRPVVFLEAQRPGRDLLQPTYSPDGTQIAYVDSASDHSSHGVWVMNADGGGAHQIVADETLPVSGDVYVAGLAWSPAGDRLALGRHFLPARLQPDGGIYTFATDGSSLERVIAHGEWPYWSPDGSQLAYSVACVRSYSGCGLAIADADGSDIREFGFAASGPWHPGTSVEDAPPTLPATPAPTLPATPTPTPTDWSPVQQRDASAVHEGHREDYGIAWRDPHDARVGWVDVERVFTQESSDGYWTIELAAKPRPAASLGPRVLVAYGLVLDTSGDGAADYVVGIDNDAPRRGDFHVWVTDLATGVTEEQVGPPYGVPIEFSHPDEWTGPEDVYNSRTLTLTFLDGTGPADLDPETVRFYAWASATRNDEVFAYDYAPDDGWMVGA